MNIRLSTGDLQDIQVKGAQEGMPYQTLIASVLHKYVTGRLAERTVTQHSRDVARQGCRSDSEQEEDRRMTLRRSR